ncbi:MAG: DNA modification methylase [Rickettsiales bacterium]|nr:DNA modification methylase [Rickettsiales bacterium]
MKVELVEITKVIPYARNPRKNEGAVAKVAASIKEFGFRQPIVVDETFTIIVGHTRLMAALALGFKQVPVHIAEGLSESQIKAYRIADNRTNEEAEWDDELLSLELVDLKNADFDLDLTGFDLDELNKILAAELGSGNTDEDAVPELEETAISKLGDVWVLGNHKLLCGDSTKKEAFDILLDGTLADMVFTDPPYNVNYGATMKDKVRGNNRTIKNDNLGAGFYDFLFASCKNIIPVCKGAIYICMSSSELHTLYSSFKDAGGHWSTFIMWAKHTFTMGRSDYQRMYEPILYGWPEGNKHYWCGDRNQSDVWNFNKPKVNDLHPTMKPVELVQKAIENSSKSRDIVLDCFGGSGSTLIACEKAGRYCYMIELDPKYCDVIVKRWQDFTGKEAVNQLTSKSFDEHKNVLNLNQEATL